MEKVTNFSGERLKGIRRRTGLTQQQVGDAIGYARSTIGVWEKGHDLPGRDALILLAEFFGLSVDRFLSGAASPAGPPKGAEFAKDANELALLEFWRELDRDQRIEMLLKLGAKGIRPGAGRGSRPQMKRNDLAPRNDNTR